MAITMSDIASKAVGEFARVRRGERVLILAGTETSDGVKAAFLAAALAAAGDHVSLASYARRPPYTDPPEPLPTAVKEADLVICLDIYLSHTTLEKEARAGGTRFLNLHPASYRALRAAFMGVDYDVIRKRGEALVAVLGAARACRVTSDLGTDLELAFDRTRKIEIGHGYAGERGAYGTLPNGKAKVPVLAKTMNGAFVVNGVIIPPLNELEETVTLVFEKGRVVKIVGGHEAKAYARFLKSFDDPGMYAVDHFTLGFNPKAALRQPKPPAFSSEAEKVMGCVNIGLGRAGLKGKQHTDVVSVGATLAADGRVILEGGQYTIW